MSSSSLDDEVDDEDHPDAIRTAVVTTRPIQIGEELFARYGDAYWNQQPIVGNILSILSSNNNSNNGKSGSGQLDGDDHDHHDNGGDDDDDHDDGNGADDATDE